ncbi:MAG: septal ring lytic transglycosylase RlpA family protein [Acidiferrobacter sp.]
MMTYVRRRRWRHCLIWPLMALVTVEGCAILPSVGYRNPAHLRNRTVVPRPLPLSPYGNNPYTVDGRTYYPLKSARGYRARGIASWYGRPFNGQRTADGSIYNMYAMTAANKVLPLPSYALVRNLNNGRSVVVLINDRGPFYPHRIIDLSYAAAAKLGVLATGTAPVEVQGIVPGESPVFDSTLPVASHGDQDDVFGPHRHRPRARRPTREAAMQNGVYVQFGAFKNPRRAARLARRVRRSHLGHARIFPRTIGRRRLYLVRLGPEGGLAAAERIATRAADRHLGPTLIVTH